MADSTQDKIDYLQGTCQSININEWTTAELEELDNQLFECAVCGWWCEQGDYNSEACEETGENVCSDCDL